MASEQQESFWVSIRDNPARRRTAIIIVGASILALIVVLVVVLVLVLKHDAQTKCRLIDEEPQPDITGRRAFPSQDYRALVRFVGHLELSKNYGPDQESKFLDLNLQSVRYVRSSDLESRHLTLETDCATIGLKISQENGAFVVPMMTVKSKSSHGDFQVAECLNIGINFWTSSYYVCTKKHQYTCSVIDPTLNASTSTSEVPEVSIVFNLLQFELDGNQIAIQDGHFDKEAAECLI